MRVRGTDFLFSADFEDEMSDDVEGYHSASWHRSRQQKAAAAQAAAVAAAAAAEEEAEMMSFQQTHNPGGSFVSMLQQHQLASFCHQRQQSRLTARQQGARMLAHFKLESVCAPGNTLLWDLLQDDKIGQLSEGLVGEAEKSLVALLCFNMERFIRYI